MSQSADVLTKEEVFILLHDLLAKKNLLNAKINIDKGSDKGDGYMSVMTKVTIADKNNKLHLMIKAAPSGKVREIAPITDAFNREHHFYNTLMPAMKKFQADRKVANPFNNVAHCYSTSVKENQEYIVMENLREQGYDLLNRKIQMDDAHVLIMLEAYAKYHAISFDMKDQDPNLYKKVQGNFAEFFSTITEDLAEQFVISIDKTIKLFEDDEFGKERLKKLRDKILPFFDELRKIKWKYDVICHADCWTYNMMFKYQNEKPVDIRIIDFQVMRVASPVLDIAVCIYCSASHEIYENIDHYLNMYHRFLSDHLKAMGTNAEYVYPLTALKDEWKQYAFFGYIFAPLVIRTLSKETGETLDIADIAETGSFKDVFNSDDENSEVANERLQRLTKHMIDNSFI